MYSIVKRIVKQIFADKRSLAILLIVPILLLTLMYLLLGKSDYIPTVAMQNIPTAIAKSLQGEAAISVFEIDSAIDGTKYLKQKNADAVISYDKDGLHILLLEMDSVKTAAVNKAVATAASSFFPSSKNELQYVYGSTDDSAFDSFSSLLLGVLSFFLIFVVSGISFVRERTANTLERLMRTPVRTLSIVCGYLLGFGVFAVAQSSLMILYAKYCLHMQIAGKWWLASLIMLLIAIIAVLLGILVSVLSQNEFQVVQFIPIVIIPQIFFSGLIPIDTLPYHLFYLSRVMPLYYGCLGLRGVLLYGSDLGALLPQIWVLLAFIFVLFAANLLAVRRYRTTL